MEIAKRIVELEGKCEQLEGEKANLQAEVEQMKKKEEKMKEKCVKQKEKFTNLEEKFNLEKNKWREEKEKMSEKFWQLEIERRRLEFDLKAVEREKADDSAALRLRLSEAEAKVQWLEDLVKEKEDTIVMLLEKIEGLGKEEKARVSELVEVKRLLEEGYSTIAELEREKRVNSVDLDRSVVEFMCTDSADNLNDVGQIVENGDVQNSGQKSSAGSHNEPQKVMCTASSAYEKLEFKKIVENGNSLSSGQKSIDGSHNEPQKESIDQSALQLIKVPNGQVQFNDCNVSISPKSAVSEVSQINDGSNKVYDNGIIRKCTTKELVSLSHERGLVAPSQPTNRTADQSIIPQRRRKVQALGCSVEKQIGIKQCKSDDLCSGRKLKWGSAQRMFNAFVANDELCMRSVCVLYRKHKSLGHWKSCSPGSRGFKPSHEINGVALGDLLTSGDPEGRLKKSVAEFERMKPNGLDDCRAIARHHHFELFAIYKDNLDPHYMPDETV